jgi:hypothetical protein
VIDCDGVDPPVLTPDRGHEVVGDRLLQNRRRTLETFPVLWITRMSLPIPDAGGVEGIRGLVASTGFR